MIAVLYKKLSSCSMGADIINQICFSISGDVSADIAHLDLAKYNKKIERTVPERPMGLKKGEGLWIVHDNEIPTSFLELLHKYADILTASLKCNGLVAYPVHVVWVNLNKQQRSCLTGHGKSLLDSFQVGSAKVEAEKGDAVIEKDASLYWFTSSDTVPLKTFISQMFSSSGRKEKVGGLSRSMRSFLEPLRKSSEIGFEVTLKEGKFWRCFPKVVLYCLDILETREMFFFRHGAGGHHPCVRCRLSSENMVLGRKNRIVCGRRQLRREDKHRV